MKVRTARTACFQFGLASPCTITAMSLALDYSSDEEEILQSVSKDAFGISSLPAAKKPRVDEPTSTAVTTAAPHVLSEVGAHSRHSNEYHLTPNPRTL